MEIEGFLQCDRLLVEVGLAVHATKGIAEALQKEGGLGSGVVVYKPFGKREPKAFKLLNAGKLDLVINVPGYSDSRASTEGCKLRQTAIDSGTSLVTDIRTAMLTV